MTNGFLEAIDVISKQGITVEYPKHFVLQKRGKQADKFWILRKGLVRYFYQWQEKEFSGWFDMENDIVGSVYSIVGMGPAKETIQLLENSELIEINLEKCHHKIPEFESFKIELLQYYFLELENRIKFFQCLDGKERYHYLLENKPQLVQRVPLRLLASFLGLTPESFSRIRKKIT